MCRMRTISKAIKEIKAIDPDSAITQHGLRQLVLNGKIPYTKFGAKYLIDLDRLQEYLSGDCAKPIIIDGGMQGQIRKIKTSGI